MASGLLVLALHRVGRPPKTATIRGLFTSEGLLNFQIKLLKWAGFQFKTLSQAVLAGEERTAVLTFDDGYEDNYVSAMPILERHGIPATLFVIASDVGKKNVTWSEAGDSTPADLMTWAMLREVEGRGWEIGSHCDEHVHLAGRSENEQEELIDAGLRGIEKELGYRPTSFAYPYGSHDESTVSALKRCRFRIAVTTERPGTAELDPASDPLRIKRLAVGGWAWHHYVKTLIRTLRVVGLANIGRGVVAGWSSPAPQTTNAGPAASHILP